MHFRVPELFLGVFIAVAIFAAGMTFEGASYQAPQSYSAQKGAHGQQAHVEPRTFGNWITHDAAGFFTAWLVLVGIDQAGLFVWQLIYMRKGMQDADRAARAAEDNARFIRNAERPYFTIFEMELIGWKFAAEKPERLPVLTINFDVENVGKGIGFFKAYSVCHEICFDSTVVKITTNPSAVIGRIPVSPDAKFRAGAPYHNFQLTDAEIDDITTFKKTLCVYGYLEYFDLFGVTRRTGFMFEFVANRIFPNEGTLGMVFHPIWRDGEIQPESKSG